MDSSATTERPSLDVDAPPTRTILAALASLVVSIPILVLLAQQFGAFGWFAARSDPDRWATPCCDYSALELGTRAFLHGEQWMGLYSRQGWRHPGPAPFLWDSLFRILPGHSFTEHQVAAVVLALLAIGALLAFIWRRASTFAALAGSSVLALWLVRFDVGMLREPWNPIAAMLWVAIFIVCASTFGSVPRSRRARWALLGATVSGSMAAQTHASAMPIVVVGGVVVLVAAWRTRDSMAVRRNLLLAAATAAVLWVLPLVDLVVGEHGLWRMFTVDEGSGGGFGWSDALRTMVQILGLGPAQQGVRLGPASPYLPTASLTIAQLVLAIIGAALGGYVLMRRRQHPRLAIAVMISFVGLMGTTLLLATSGSAFYPYLLLPVAMCGPMLWICGAIAIAEALLPRMSRITRATASGVAIVALVVLGVIGIRELPTDTLLDRYASPSLLDMERSILDDCDAVPSHPIVYVQPGVDWTVALPLIATIDRCAPVRIRTWESFLAGQGYDAPASIERDSVWILPVDALNFGKTEIASDGQVMVLVEPELE